MFFNTVSSGCIYILSVEVQTSQLEVNYLAGLYVLAC